MKYHGISVVLFLPVTFLLDPEPSSIHGPDSDPVGFGVALSYIFPMSSFDDLHRWPGWYGSAAKKITSYDQITEILASL